MVLLSLLGVALGAAAINSAAKQHGKKTNPKLNTTKFDADSARYGVATSSAGFTRQKIIDIAARCGVQSNKYGVLPEDGWKHCIKYVSNYINDPQDIANFERDWKITVASQLEDRSEQTIKKYWDDYQRQYKKYLKNKEYWTTGPIVTLQFKHWHGLPKDQYLKRLENIQTKTFWGELVHTPPILRNNPNFKNSFIEVWVMKGSKGDTQGSYLTNNRMKLLYKRCCGVCGYDAML